MQSDQRQTGAVQRVLFIANGNGEDSIAAEIIRKLPKAISVEAYPMVGSGAAYEALCPLVGPRAQVPSEGWRHTAGSVSRDLKGGMLASVGPAIKFLRSIRGRYDRVVVVGDGVGPLLCWLAGLQIDIYLDVFKSGYAHTYGIIERFIIGRAAKTVFCRDHMLATTLRHAKIDGRSVGNVMLDCVPHGAYDFHKRRAHHLAVTLLPGSRATTAYSLKMQVDALKLLPPQLVPDVFVAIAKGIDPQRLATATGLTYKSGDSNESADRGTLTGKGLTLHLAHGVLGNLIEVSDVVLSQAGTATQQALGLGTPVITFNRADNRAKRMADEQALMGEARILTAETPQALVEALGRLLADPNERVRLGDIGRQRLGGAGTIDAMLEMLTPR
jgi:uncharacterized protein (TIGR03492 family)